MAAWPKPKSISLPLQEAALRWLFPESSAWIRRSELIWQGTLTPSVLSLTYKVRLRYKLTGSPEIEVLSPRLQKRGSESPPHLYPGERLCLYLPCVGEWNKTMMLSQTIIPWTSEWLLNYEIWLSTGAWCGGGLHPNKEGASGFSMGTDRALRSGSRWPS